MKTSSRRRSDSVSGYGSGSEVQPLDDPRVVARDESGPRYWRESPLRQAFCCLGPGDRIGAPVAKALADHYTSWQQPGGSIIGRASVWIVTATNPG
jgi:hypothetical protein